VDNCHPYRDGSKAEVVTQDGHLSARIAQNERDHLMCANEMMVISFCDLNEIKSYAIDKAQTA